MDINLYNVRLTELIEILRTVECEVVFTRTSVCVPPRSTGRTHNFKLLNFKTNCQIAITVYDLSDCQLKQSSVYGANSLFRTSRLNCELRFVGSE